MGGVPDKAEGKETPAATPEEKKDTPQIAEAKVEPAPAAPEQKQEIVVVVPEPKKEADATSPAQEQKVEVPQSVPQPQPQPQVPPAKTEQPKDGDEDQVMVESPTEEEQKQGEKKPRYPLLEKLLSFLRPTTEVNAVLAGYFTKVLMAILEKRRLEFMTYIFFFYEHVENFLKHSYSKSISEVISKLLSNEDKFLSDMTGEEFVVERQDILRKMIRKMEPSNSIEEITNNCFILCTLLDTKQQLQFFMKEDVLRSIFEIALTGKPMSLRAGLTFFITLNRLRSAPVSGMADQFSLIGADQTAGTVGLSVS